MGNTYTWIGAAGVAAEENIAADWSPNGGPQPGDTGVLTNNGTILFDDGLFQSNTLILGTGLAVFAGDSLVTFSAPDLDAASLITTNTGTAVAQNSTIDAFGNFVNAGTILADGAAGSTLTINVGTTVFNGITVAGYAYNTGLIQADAGNTITVAIGGSSELFSAGAIVANGGNVTIQASPSAIAGGYAGIAGFVVIEDGGTLETQASYPLISGSQPGGTTPRYEFGDTTPGNTLKIDNLGSFGGAIVNFQAGDTVDLGTSIAVATLVFGGTTGLLQLENATGTILDSLYLSTNGMVTSGTFQVTGGTADGINVGTGVDGDTILTTNRTIPSAANVSGNWQTSTSWSNFTVPGTTDSAFIGAVATAGTSVNPFSLTTGSAPVSVAGISLLSANATLTITSNTTVQPGIVNDYVGTLVVQGGNTLSTSSLRTFSPQTSITVAAGATIDVTGRPGSSFAATAGTIAITNSNSGAVQISAGTLLINGALLAGPPAQGGAGGNTVIGEDSAGMPAAVTVIGDGTATDGQVTDTYTLLGSDPTSSGTLTLNGPGASWTDTIDLGDTSNDRGYMLVGYNNLSSNTPAGLAQPPYVQAAQLTIENGATLTDQQSAQVADTVNSAGNVTVSGGGFWNLAASSSFIHNGTTIANVSAGFVNIGLAGTGSLSVLNGGSVAIGGLLTYLNNGTTATGGGIGIGRSATATGTVLVSGAGSQLSSLSSGIGVGQSGQGLLNIVNGGTVLVSAGGGIGVGLTAGASSSGTIDVGGPGLPAFLNFAAASGSVVAASGLTIGQSSRGMLNVMDNGTINLNGTDFLTVGSGVGAIGTVVVAGTTASALINLGTDNVTDGFMGTGQVTIGSLGTLAMNLGGGIEIGANAGSSGSLLVNAGMVIEGATSFGINVGGAGSGTATVNNGGNILMNGTGALSIGVNTGGSGQMTVAGGTVAFSDATNFGINVGSSGSGTLTVSDNGVINLNTNGVGNGYLGIANAVGSTGTVVVGGSAAPAVINLGGGGLGVGNAGAGTLTVNSRGLVAITGTAGITVGFTTGAIGVLTVNGGVITEGASSHGITMANSAGATASMLIENGGTVSLAGGGVNIASIGSGAAGTVTVTGANALLKSTGTGNVIVGGPSNATLKVTNGGSLALLGTGGITIDSTNGTPSQMTVAGASVSFGVNGGFFGVGQNGAGTLTVSDNGIVNINGTGTNGSGFLGIGNNAGSNGSVVVGGTAAAATINLAGGGLSIGNDGTAGLTVNKFGTVMATGTVGITVGYSTSAVGMMTVNDGLVTLGAGSFGINLGVTSNATGSLLVENAGIVTLAGGSLNLGFGANASGTVTVTGAGSKITANNFVTVGNSGNGTLTVSNGGSLGLTGTGSMTIGASGGSASEMTVSGGIVSLAATVGGLFVGSGGAGALTIDNGGALTDGSRVSVGFATGGNGAVTIRGGALSAVGIDDAQASGATGAITVIGSQSSLTSTGSFVVGDAGVGSLAIDGGGVVTAGAGLVIANTTAASGSSVNVTGTGSKLTITGSLVVGNGGAGALLMDGGASVTAASLDVAAGASGDGAVSLSGAGTTLTLTGSLTLGDQSAGELSILGGAHMTIGTGGLVGGTGANAAGNLDIEGNGSQLTINGGTLVVGENGPAEFTLGIGATLTGEVATSQFGVTNEYGNVDPATDPNDGTQNVGFGNSLLYDFFVANSGTIKITSGTATFYTPLVTDETNAQDGSTNGLWVIGAKDTLVMNATSVDNTQTFDFTSPTAASLVIGQVPQGDINNLDTLNGATTPTLTGSIAPGAANVLPGWQAPIENYQSGDVIRLQGLTYGSATVSGDVVTVWSGAAGAGSALGSLVFIDKSDSTTSAAALASAAAAQVQINSLACFAAGTRIATADGWINVENLRVGDLVITLDGRHEPIVWLGSRTVDCLRHPAPETVWPVRIAAGAFGENAPDRALYLSPDHAVFVNDVLVPARLLTNGETIAQEERDQVTYFHVELPRHAVILADNLSVESYLDTGDRANFGNSATTRLFPDFAARISPTAAMIWETQGAAALVLSGPRLDAARAAVAVCRRPRETRLNRRMPSP